MLNTFFWLTMLNIYKFVIVLIISFNDKKYNMRLVYITYLKLLDNNWWFYAYVFHSEKE